MIKKRFFHLQIFSFLVFLIFLILALNVASRRVEARLIGRPAPEINNEVWINSPSLRLANLHGKVVLMEFWTYG